MMKYSFLIFLLCTSILTHGQTIQCPQDTVYAALDYLAADQNYGDPVVTGGGEVIRTIENLSENCIDTSIHIRITYTLNNTSGSPIAACTQKIQAITATFDDIIYPDSIVIDSGNLSRADPEYTGEPNLIVNEYNLFFYYTDVILDSPYSYKVIRTWTALDWCSGETEESFQVITIIKNGGFSPGLFPVIDCSNDSTLVIQEFSITTDLPNYNIEYGTCIDSTSSFSELLNCVAGLNDIPDSNNIELNISFREDEVLDGVSTLDLVIIQRHILGAEVLSDPCSIIAADVNGDGVITAIDLFTLRRIILGITNEFPNSNAWQFYNAEFFNTNNPFTETKDLKFKKSEFPIGELEIITIKSGDVNGSH